MLNRPKSVSSKINGSSRNTFSRSKLKAFAFKSDGLILIILKGWYYKPPILKDQFAVLKTARDSGNCFPTRSAHSTGSRSLVNRLRMFFLNIYQTWTCDNQDTLQTLSRLGRPPVAFTSEGPTLKPPPSKPSRPRPNLFQDC